MKHASVNRNGRAMPYIGRLKALDPTDYVQTRMSIPASLVTRLHEVKRLHRLRTRDAVIGSMLRIARTQHHLDDFVLPPEPAEDDPMHAITAEIEAEHIAFLYRLQRKFRGAALGAALEAVAGVVSDLAPPVQLELIGLCDPTSAVVERLPAGKETSASSLVYSSPTYEACPS